MYVCRIKLFCGGNCCFWSAAEVSYFQAPLTYNNAALLNVRAQVEGLKKEKGAAAQEWNDERKATASCDSKGRIAYY